MATMQLQSLVLSSSSRVPSLTFSPPVSGSDAPLEPIFQLAPPREPRGGCVACEARYTDHFDWERLVLEAESTVVVGFYAPWSGPLILDEVAKEYSGRLKCYKLNIDENPSTASRYPSRTLPTVLIFKNGERKDTVGGVVPKTT